MHALLSWIQTHGELAFVILFTLNAILTAFVILMENREPERSIAWFLVLFTFPLIGFIFYLFLGRDWHKRSYRQKRMSHMLTARRRHVQVDEAALPGAGPLERMLRHLNTNMTGLPATRGNRVTILTDADEKYPRMFAALRAAKRTIDVEYFIFRNDETGDEVITILKERAAHGVKIRFMVDGMGSFGFGAKRFADMRAAGVQAHYFSPLITLFYFLKANYRDHRKIVVIDDEVAFTGGINIGKEYLGDTRRGPWRDTSVELRGPCVQQMGALFDENWRRTTGEPLRTDRPLPREEPGGETVDVVPSGPDADWKAIHQLYLAMIHGARKRIRIQSPYFIPDESLVAALILAPLRGVEVELMIPQKPDWPYLRWVAQTYLDDLLRAGVRVFEYRPGFLHPKVIIVDDEVATVGTCNVDIRSLRLDFEVNLLVSGPATMRHLNEDFERDRERCEEIDYSAFIERPLRYRVKESLARLISPLL